MGFYLISGSFSRLNPFSGNHRHILSSRLSLFFFDEKGLKQSIEQKLNLPAKPKKPLTPFFRFMKQIRPSIIEENPNLPITEISRRISQKWGNIDPKVRNDIELQYHKDKEAYDQARLNYESSLSSEQKDAMAQERLKIVQAKTKRKLKKKAKEQDKPKKPPTSYGLFVLSKANSRGNIPVTEWSKDLSKEWKNLDEAKKNKFINEAKELQAKFSKDLEVWEEKMVNLGHVDLLRTESLKPKIKSSKKK